MIITTFNKNYNTVTATIGRPKPDGLRRPKFAGEDGQFNDAVELAIFLT